MGQTLSEPVTEKETTSCSDENFYVGASCMQGWRINMEDCHTHILKCKPYDPTASFFAVYDGHGGDKVAQFASTFLHRKIIKQTAYMEGNYENSIRNAFLQTDADMLYHPDIRDELAGSTAVCLLCKNNKIYVGNVGDSRAVACWNGRVDPLSIDHKPSNESESKRITAAGGYVEFNRVNGNLALSRALGDFIFKRNENKSVSEQIVIACPDIEVRTVNEELEFVVLACDGIWDVMTNEEVVEFIRCRIGEKMEPPEICEELMTRCLAPSSQMGGLGCDNMTVVLVCFLHNKTYHDLCARCALPANRIHSTGSMDLGSPSTSSSSLDTIDEEMIKEESEDSGAIKVGGDEERNDLKQECSEGNGERCQEFLTQAV